MIGQTVSAVTSLASLAWALTAYHRALRCSLMEKANMSYEAMGLYFLWRVFTIGARVVALAMFASRFQLYVFIITTSHWMGMLTWIRFQETKFCMSNREEIFFNIVASVVYIFCYFNLVEGHTRLRYLFYYIIVYAENAAMILTWYFLTQTQDMWYHMPAIAIVLGGFFIGIIFQVIYYIHFHPNNKYPSICIKIWVPCKALSISNDHAARRDPSFEIKHMVDGNPSKVSRMASTVPATTVVKSKSDGMVNMYKTSVMSSSHDSDHDITNSSVMPLMESAKQIHCEVTHV